MTKNTRAICHLSKDSATPMVSDAKKKYICSWKPKIMCEFLKTNDTKEAYKWITTKSGVT